MDTNLKFFDYFIQALCFIWIIILFFKFIRQIVTYVLAFIKNKRHGEDNTGDWIGNETLLCIRYFVLTIIWIYLDNFFSINKIFLLISIALSSLNTIINLLLYTWLWREKGKKFILCCSLILISAFCVYAILAIYII